MKLFLTSNGLQNQALVDGLAELVGKPLRRTKLAFIPSAAHAVEGDHDWLIQDLVRLRKHCRIVNVVEIAALDIDTIVKRLEFADVICFGGGNAFFLKQWLERSGLLPKLPALLEDRVYMGISAGSFITGPDLSMSSQSSLWGYENPVGSHAESGHGFTNLRIRPHLGRGDFRASEPDEVRRARTLVDGPVVGIDDDCAVSINGDEVKLVGTGQSIWLD